MNGPVRIVSGARHVSPVTSRIDCALHDATTGEALVVGRGNLGQHPFFDEFPRCETGSLRGKCKDMNYLFLRVGSRGELMGILGAGNVRGVPEGRISSRDYQRTSGLISAALSSYGKGRTPREALYRWIASTMQV